MINPGPKLHKPVPMNTRVRIPHYFSKDKTVPLFGTVVGVSSVHVIYTYIVLLDNPIESEEFGELKAVAVNGPELESEDGHTSWKILDNMERVEAPTYNITGSIISNTAKGIEPLREQISYKKATNGVPKSF